MRVVLYAEGLVPLHILELDEDELDALDQGGPLAFEVPRHPAYDALVGPPHTVVLMLGAFELPDGVHEVPFLVLQGEGVAELMATDAQGAFPEGTESLALYRKEFAYAVVSALQARCRAAQDVAAGV